MELNLEQIITGPPSYEWKIILSILVDMKPFLIFCMHQSN